MINKTQQIFSLNFNKLNQNSNKKQNITDYPADEFVKTESAVSFKGRNQEFIQVAKNYFRGKKPDSITLSHLQERGVNTIIDLTGSSTDSFKQKIKEFGMKYHNIPLNENIRPTDEEIKAFKEIVNTPGNKVYVHCREGRNRTGMMTAVYEITENGKDFRTALADMLRNGYDFINYPDTIKFLGEIGIKNGEKPANVEKIIQELTSNGILRYKLMQYNGIY